MALKMSKKLDNKRGGHFNIALIIVFLSIAVSLIAFMSEDTNNVTGFVTSATNEESSYSADAEPVLREFNNLDDLRSLAKGNYYIDDEGVVYWLDDDSRPAVAKVIYIRDIQKNRKIYIDNSGNIGYALE